jgi:hypothetical protein
VHTSRRGIVALLEKTERYCVVLRTLTAPPAISTMLAVDD